MKNYETSARITLYACRTVAVLAVAMIPSFPMLLNLYAEYLRPLGTVEKIAFLAAFYTSVPAVLLALYEMDRLLKNILEGQLFVIQNVRYIRVIRWCCLEVSLACLGGTFGFPALILLAGIMAFLCLVVTVVGQVMKAGVEIREENDLTV